MKRPTLRFPLFALALLSAPLAACSAGPHAVTTDGGPWGDSGSFKTSSDTGEAGPGDARDAPNEWSPGTDAGADAGETLDAKAQADGDAASRCTMTPTEITCTQQLYTITTPAGSDPGAGTTYPSYQRVVHYQVPLGTAPEAGWPTVLLYQGSFVSAGLTFSASSTDPFGMYYQTELVKVLLDAGYAVLAPEALGNGETYWQTNIAPYAANWSGAPDDVLVEMMLADVAAGTFGPLDPNALYATGLSSGGYMTSRMAIGYVGKFKALAIESAAYATCLSGESAVTGGVCTVPPLSSSHPPMLFLHGDLDTTIIPEWTVQLYEAALQTAGITYDEIDDADSGHQWIPEGPAAVLSWFKTHP